MSLQLILQEAPEIDLTIVVENTTVPSGRLWIGSQSTIFEEQPHLEHLTKLDQLASEGTLYGSNTDIAMIQGILL